MSYLAFMSRIQAFEADVIGSPETCKALLQMVDLIEQAQDQIAVLLAANRKLLDVIDILKNK